MAHVSRPFGDQRLKRLAAERVARSASESTWSEPFQNCMRASAGKITNLESGQPEKLTDAPTLGGEVEYPKLRAVTRLVPRAAPSRP
jgi:hypothetical protein